MTKYFFITLLTCLLSLPTASQLLAQDVTLTWDASPSEEVTGYKVYYKPNNQTLPLNGVGANEGPSPVDAGKALSFTLTGLADKTTHYIAVTAYNAKGDESSFSNIVSVNNGELISLVRPAPNAQDEPIPATFQWTFTEVYPTLEYTLYYGTDAKRVESAGAFSHRFPPPPANSKFLNWGLVALLVLTGSLLFSERKWNMAIGVFAFSLALSACGGSSGGDSGVSSNKTSNELSNTANPLAVYSVKKGTYDYHQAFDLLPGTTYYWKVIGVEMGDPTQVYTSSLASFTTETF